MACNASNHPRNQRKATQFSYDSNRSESDTLETRKNKRSGTFLGCRKHGKKRWGRREVPVSKLKKAAMEKCPLGRELSCSLFRHSF
jgi:hypothetical protein